MGGTSVTDPKALIKTVDLDEGRPGMRILVTEPTGQRAALLEVDERESPAKYP